MSNTSKSDRADPILEHILAKCALPTTEDLRNHKKCLVCYDAFLAHDAEIPIKLPCDHVIGTTCILEWLSPLSGNPRNSCPYCGDEFIDYDQMRHIQRSREVLERLEEGTADDQMSVSWSSEAYNTEQHEGIWIQVCEDFVELLEETAEVIEGETLTTAELFVEELCPFVLTLIECVTLKRYVKVHDKLSRGWQKISLTAPESYDRLREILANSSDVGEKTYRAADEDAFLRAARYHSRIKRSRAILSDEVRLDLELTAGMVDD